MIRRAVNRASDRVLLAAVTGWGRLTPDERRLVYLNRMLGISLREITRLQLLEPAQPNARHSSAPSPRTLRRKVREIERKVERAEHRQRRYQAGDQPPPDASSETG